MHTRTEMLRLGRTRGRIVEIYGSVRALLGVGRTRASSVRLQEVEDGSVQVEVKVIFGPRVMRIWPAPADTRERDAACIHFTTKGTVSISGNKLIRGFRKQNPIKNFQNIFNCLLTRVANISSCLWEH